MPQPWHYRDDRLLVRKLCVGPLENNVYVVACAATHKAVIVDAADEASRVVAAVADLDPVAILTTHGHWDHVQAAAEVRQRLDVPFRISQADAELAGLEPDDALSDEPVIVGELEIGVIPTPGHTPGSTTFAVGPLLLTGDTLFPGGPGATAGAAEFATIMNSLDTALFTFGDATLVLPGHGLDTTIGTERPSLPAWRARGW